MRLSSLLLVSLLGCPSGDAPDPTPEPEPTPEPTPGPSECEGDQELAGDVEATDDLCAANRCVTVVGSLHVEAGEPALGCLVEVGGNLLIDGYEGDDLNGLTALQRVGGDFRIDRNRLEVVSAPAGLLSVGGDFEINETNAMLEGRFTALVTVGGDLEFNVLGGTARLPALETVGNLEILGPDVTVVDLGALRVVDLLGIAWSYEMDSLGDIGALETVGELSIQGLDSLDSLGGLVIPAEVTRRVALTENPDIEDISGLAGLRRTGTLLMRNNFSLSDVTALHGIESLSGDLIIEDCTDLRTEDAEALRDAIGIENIGGAVVITGNKIDD